MNAATQPTPDTQIEEAVDAYALELREKILFGLAVYQAVSPTMLQVFLGTSTPTKLWKPILKALEAEGKVCREEVPLTTPHDRVNSYTILHLPSNPYSVPTQFQANPQEG